VHVNEDPGLTQGLHDLDQIDFLIDFGHSILAANEVPLSHRFGRELVLTAAAALAASAEKTVEKFTQKYLFVKVFDELEVAK
jgi:hypothetical protein